MTLRHFPYRHPTFGTEKNPKTSSHWKVSVYYWWYEYLRKNEDYRKTCDKGGNGRCAKVYANFGDVFSQEFKQWWSENDRGAVLFAEPPKPSIQVISSETFTTGGVQRPNSLILEVPLGLPITFLVKNFRKIVSKVHDGKRGTRLTASSQAMYVPSGKIDVGFLEIALSVWDQKKSEPNKPLWQIAQDLGIGGTNKIKAGDPPAVVTDKKNVLAATASRYYRKATAMIKRVGEGRFPH